MKSKLKICLLFCLSSLGCFSQMNRESSLIKNNLKGKIQSIKNSTYKAEEYNGVIIKGTKTERLFDTQYSNYDIYYNTFGNITQRNNYDEVGELYSNDYFFYDQDNRKIEQYKVDTKKNKTFQTKILYLENTIEINSYELPPELKSFEKEYYNNSGKITEKKEFDSNGLLQKITVFEYDKNNNLIKMSFKNEGGLVEKFVDYNYDTNGVIMAEKRFENELIISDKVTQYDNKKEITEKTNFVTNTRTKFIRNRIGDIILEQFYKPINYLKTTTKYDIKYDDYGNWITRITNINNIPSYIQERNIIYY